jgi:exonuclease SbcC
VPKERPDTANIEAELRRNQTAQGVAATRLTKLSSLNQRIEEFDVHHVKLRPQAEEAQSRLLEANALEKAMNTGQGVGVGRVYRLQEWIQRRLFEQVCRVASEQLRTLTEGRYIITLEADAEAVVRRAQGLDLYVVDSHQGTKRGVGTLSGGETFLASLALALALAEVVQTHAGGIKLPCLFIDEGFGSLDRETLSCATEVLKTLQGSGRTIGVITHVDAMHEDLHPGIRVIKTDSGSRLEYPLKQ